MMNKILIAVDPGKYATKGVIKQDKKYHELTFRTKILKLTSNNVVDILEKSFKIKHNKHDYIIGNMGEYIEYDSSKTHLVHKLATYIEITKFLHNNYQVVQLVLGCPVLIYKNKKKRQEYKEFILNKPSKIIVNDTIYKFDFENILLMPEGSGIVYYQPYLFKSRRIPVLDWGGRNLTFGIYDDLEPKISSMNSNEMGSFDLEKTLINELNGRYNQSLTVDDIATIIKNGVLKDQGEKIVESTTIINNIMNSFVSDAIKDMRRNGLNLNNFENVVFIGGLSNILKRYINSQLKHAIISSEAQSGGVKGFYEIGTYKYDC